MNVVNYSDQHSDVEVSIGYIESWPTEINKFQKAKYDNSDIFLRNLII